jgi:hypothetical protein
VRILATIVLVAAAAQIVAPATLAAAADGASDDIGDVADDGGAPAAGLRCDPVRGPGRVRCTIDVRAADGETIPWADAVLVAAPPFIAPLRGRLGPHDASERGPRVWTWAFAVVARGGGQGALRARVRLVLCRGASCRPHVVALARDLTPPP